MIKSNNNKVWNKKFILTNNGTPGGSTSVDSSGSLTSLTTVAQGTTQQTRVGNHAILKRVWGNICMYADSTDVQNNMRLMIISWTDATTPTMSDVLVSASAYTNCYYNLNNIENGKLRVLLDEHYPISYQGNGPKAKHVDLKLNMPLQWATTGSAAPIINGIYLVLVSDSSVVTHPSVQSSWVAVLDNE